MYSKLRKLGPKAAAVALTATLLVTLPTPALLAESRAAVAAADVRALSVVQTEVQQAFRIVGIGDSLTAGYEYGMEKLDPIPVPYGYVDRLYEQALFRSRAEVANYGVLGLKAAGLQRWLAEAVASGTAPSAEAVQPGLGNYPLAEETLARTSELLADLAAADVIAITIGGNDFPELLAQVPAGRAVSDAWLASALDAYEEEVRSIIDTLLTLNPQAQIVISDLYLPLPNNPLALGALGLTRDDYAYLVQATATVRERLTAIARSYAGNGSTTANGSSSANTSSPVSPGGNSTGSAVNGPVTIAYSGEAFIGQENRLTSVMNAALAGDTDLHPTQLGYAAIAAGFTTAIWGELRTVAPRPEGVNISVVVNGKELLTDYRPVLRASRTYVAFRDIADAMGAETTWNNATRTVTVTYGDKSVALTIGSSVMRVNGQAVAIDTPPFLHPVGRELKTYVPLAVLADGLGFQVVYSAKLRTAFINK